MDVSLSSSSSTESESDDEFMKAHYLKMVDMSDWGEKNMEILIRWQEEVQFTVQIQDDVLLQDAFKVIAREMVHPEKGDVVFSSSMKTINRAFSNRFNMVCELVREAKKDVGLSNELLDEVAQELLNLKTMLHQFQHEEGDFQFFYQQTCGIFGNFVKWRNTLKKEETPKKGESSSEEEEEPESQLSQVTLSPPHKKCKTDGD